MAATGTGSTSASPRRCSAHPLPGTATASTPTPSASRAPLGRLVSFMDGYPRAGLAGSTINGADGTGRVFSFRFPTALSELCGEARLGLLARLLPEAVVALREPADTTEVDWISGVSMLIRR